jgi:hypothetical protein
MTKLQMEILDLALERQAAGEPQERILAEFPENMNELQPLLATAAALEFLPPLELPPAAAWYADRQDFLAEVRALNPQERPAGLIDGLQAWFVDHAFWRAPIVRKKEPRTMFPLLVKAVIVLSLIFGSLGGTAAVSATSLPDSPLYPLKLMFEDARLAVAEGPKAKAEIRLRLAQARVDEIVALVNQDDFPEESVMVNHAHQWREAMRLMVQASDEDLVPLLARAEHQVNAQTMIMSGLEAENGEDIANGLAQLNQVLASVRATISTANGDPQQYRNQFANGLVDPPGAGEGYGPGPGDRSEERRVGKECTVWCRSRGSPYH